MSDNRQPRVRRSFSVVGHSPDVVELRTGVWNAKSYTLTDDSRSGKLFNLVSGLDGTLSRRDLAKREGVSRVEVEALVDHLYGLDAIEEGPSSALDAYLDTMATLGGRGQTPVSEGVVLLGDPELAERTAALLPHDVAGDVLIPGPDHPVRARLDALAPAVLHDGLAFDEAVEILAPWRGRYLLLAERTVDPVRARLLNRLTRAAGISWTYAAVDGPFLFVGPTMVAGRSACFECFETRVTMNLRESAGYQRYKEALVRSAVHAGAPPVYGPVQALLCSHLALEATNYLSCGSTLTIEQVLGCYLPSMEISYQSVLPLPGCPGCGPVPERDDETLHFDPRTWLED
ncbi:MULTISPECIES: TOMM precursor leader peptide-binding protein [unclassified Streptomyces]|uniref:TOMM precursor leader peptide-binding protein n=1 Tax=unclassified Streptomyces TaxID=2593676 RepID=UPI0033E12910